MRRCTRSSRVGVAALALLVGGQRTAMAAVGGGGHRGEPTVYDELPREALEEMVDQLSSDDPAVRTRGALLANNLPGTALPFVETTLASGAVAPEASAVLGKALPVLKTRARIATLGRAEDDRFLKATLDAYDKHGRHDPRWDESARTLIRGFAKPPALRSGEAETDQGIVAAAAAAMAVGCDDPLVAYVRARMEAGMPSTERGLAKQRYVFAANAMVESQYPAEFKFMAAANYIVDTDAFGHTNLEEAVFANFGEAVRVEGNSESALDVAQLALKAVGDRVRRKIKGVGDAPFKRLYEIYTAARPPADSGPLTFKGLFFTEYAWDARGSGWANTVTPEGWRLFRERLKIARESLTKAWEMDHTNVVAAAGMIPVVMGAGSETPNESELWLRRATEADPDSRTAYSNHLYALYPRWGGSHEEMLLFGRQCLASGNWRGRVPFILMDAHLQIASEMEDPAAYLASPEVWRDTELCYGGFLDLYPDSTWHLSKFAWFACKCSKWREADRLFKKIGKDPDLRVFPSKSIYDYYCKKAATLAKQGALE